MAMSRITLEEYEKDALRTATGDMFSKEPKDILMDFQKKEARTDPHMTCSFKRSCEQRKINGG